MFGRLFENFLLNITTTLYKGDIWEKLSNIVGVYNCIDIRICG